MRRLLLLTFVISLISMRLALARAQHQAQQELDLALLSSVEKQNTAEVDDLLSRGANPNARYANSLTVLMVAIRTGRRAIVNMLLCRAADLSLRDRRGNSALHVGMVLYNRGVMSLLLEAQPNLESRNKYGETPLMLAAESGYEEAFELLASRGADVLARDWRGRTALHHACEANAPRLAIVDALVSRGVPVGTRDSSGRTALACVLDGGGSDRGGHDYTRHVITKRLIEAGSDVNATARNGSTPIMLAAGSTGIDTVMLLLERGADVRAKDAGGHNALSYMIQNGHGDYSAIASALIERGADVRVVGKSRDSGRTPILIDAARHAADVVVSKMLERGVNVETQDSWGRTALMIAVEAESLATVTQLLENGANVNARDDEGKTPFMYATNGPDYSKIASLLLEHGADARACDKQGRTVLMSAVPAGDAQLINELVSKGADVNAKDRDGNTALMIPEWGWDPEEESTGARAALIAAGAEVMARNRQGMTPLHWAARDGRPAAIRLLTKSGADINARDRKGRTALHSAADFQEWHHTAGGYLCDEAARVLLDHGVDVNARTRDGHIALDYAIRKQSGDEIVRVLIQGGADVNRKDPNGVTPLMWHAHRYENAAIRSFGEEVTEALLRKGARIGLIEALLMSDYSTALQQARVSDDVDTPGPFSETALMIAARRGYSDIVDLLLDKRADVGRTDKRGRTALHFAVNALAQSVTDYKEPPDETGVPKPARLDIVRSLLKAGADPSAVFLPIFDNRSQWRGRTYRKESALQWAEARKYNEIAAVLRDAIAQQQAAAKRTHAWTEQWD